MTLFKIQNGIKVNHSTVLNTYYLANVTNWILDPKSYNQDLNTFQILWHPLWYASCLGSLDQYEQQGQRFSSNWVSHFTH